MWTQRAGWLHEQKRAWEQMVSRNDTAVGRSSFHDVPGSEAGKTAASFFYRYKMSNVPYLQL